MADRFDPYQKWLAIPRSQQPADHYRLLGIPRLTADADVIENAAAQRMNFLRTVRSGQHRELAERLLGEVATARACLLDAARKAAYDAMLADASSAAGSQAEAASPPQVERTGPRRPPNRPLRVPMQAPPPVVGEPPAPNSPPATAAPPPIEMPPPMEVPAVGFPNSVAAPLPVVGRTRRRSRIAKKSKGTDPVAMTVLLVGVLIAVGVGLYFVLGRDGDKRDRADQAAPSTLGTSEPVQQAEDPNSIAKVDPDVEHAPRPAAPRPPRKPEPPAAPAAPLIPRTQRSPEERVGLLSTELGRAFEDEDLGLALALTRQIAELEQHDALKRQAETLVLFADKATSPISQRAIVREAAPLVRAAVRAKRQEIARQGAVLALVAARSLDDADAIREATFLVLAARQIANP